MMMFEVTVAFCFLVFLGFVWYFRHAVEHHVLQRLFAWTIMRELPYVNETLKEDRTCVFQFVRQHQETINRELHILDIGSGPASNLQFVPQNAKLVCLDPNPHFASYIRDKIKKADALISIDVVQGYAEEMPFECDAFDVVVCTLVLCTVNNIEKSLQEIRRVLKPGGKLVFMDHVLVDDKSSWTYMLQLISSPYHRLLYGCHITRNIEYYVKGAGFSDVCLHLNHYEAAPLWLKARLIGVATK